MLRVDTVNGVEPEVAKRRPYFDSLVPVFPDEMFDIETDQKNLTQRLINLISPIGKGQRGLILSPAKAGKTTVLKHIAAGITENTSGSAPHGRPHRRAARGSHRHAAQRRRRDLLVHLRRADREPHPRRGDVPRDREAPGGDRA